MLESVGDDYSAFGHARISTFTGLPTVMGWTGHELQWGHDPGSRRADVDLLYKTPDAAVARPLLDQLRRALRRRRADRARRPRRRRAGEVGPARPPRLRPRRDDGVGAALIELGDAPAAWAALGFAPDAAGEVVLGEARLRLTGRGGGILGIEAADADRRPAGRPAADCGARRAPRPPASHPNGATVVDHVVALTGSLERTVAALTAAGLDLRRSAGTMAFLRLGPMILEVVERGEDPPRLWGLVVVVPELEGLGRWSGRRRTRFSPGGASRRCRARPGSARRWR